MERKIKLKAVLKIVKYESDFIHIIVTDVDAILLKKLLQTADKKINVIIEI